MAKPKLFDINEVKWENWGEDIRACVFKPTENATVQYWEIQPGAGAAPHSHPAEQLIYIQEGYLDVTIEGKTYDLGPGCFCLVPSGAIHSTCNNGKVMCVNVDVFMPERDDRTESIKDCDKGHSWYL